MIAEPLFIGYPLSPVMLLPADSQDRLHILRLLIDRLIPREASLCGEPGHRLDQLIDLRVEQRMPIAGLDGLEKVFIEFAWLQGAFVPY